MSASQTLVDLRRMEREHDKDRVTTAWIAARVAAIQAMHERSDLTADELIAVGQEIRSLRNLNRDMRQQNQEDIAALIQQDPTLAQMELQQLLSPGRTSFS